ncbi:hypothetical protein VULLAG_LOCUS6746 [Vulpes lagopus]
MKTHAQRNINSKIMWHFGIWVKIGPLDYLEQKGVGRGITYTPERFSSYGTGITLSNTKYLVLSSSEGPPCEIPNCHG